VIHTNDRDLIGEIVTQRLADLADEIQLTQGRLHSLKAEWEAIATATATERVAGSDSDHERPSRQLLRRRLTD